MKKCQGCSKKVKNCDTFCVKCMNIEEQNEELEKQDEKKKLYPKIEIIVSFK